MSDQPMSKRRITDYHTLLFLDGSGLCTSMTSIAIPTIGRPDTTLITVITRMTAEEGAAEDVPGAAAEEDNEAIVGHGTTQEVRTTMIGTTGMTVVTMTGVTTNPAVDTETGEISTKAAEVTSTTAVEPTTTETVIVGTEANEARVTGDRQGSLPKLT